MTTVDSASESDTEASTDCCQTAAPTAERAASLRGPDWHWGVRWARRLAWVSFVLVVAEGAVGLWQGAVAGSIALVAWALGGAPEALGSLVVVWRFSGSRAVSDTAERRAQRGIAVSFWLTAPYLASESVDYLLTQHEPRLTLTSLAVTAVALLQMPVLGWAQRRLGDRLGSSATVSKGTQSYLCAAQALAVFVGLLVTAQWPAGWWLDPVIGLGIAAVEVWQGIRAWRGQGCGC